MRTLRPELPETESEADSVQSSAGAPHNWVKRVMLIGSMIVLSFLVAAVVWFSSSRETLNVHSSRETKKVHGSPLSRMLSTECDTNPTGRELKALAPDCVKACPHVCHELNATIRRVKEGASLQGEACRGPMAQALVCAVDAAHADACAPVLDHAEQMGAALPRKLLVLDAACGRGSSAGGAVAKSMRPRVEAALWARALQGQSVATPQFDKGIAGKRYDDRCQDQREGNMCIAKEPGAYIYCSVNKRLSSPSYGWNCSERMGSESRCLDKNLDYALFNKIRCDDPFCRNGGANYGDGTYCHKDAVVQCTGDQEPRILQKCEDKITYLGLNNSCFKKTVFSCFEDGPNTAECRHDHDDWFDPFNVCTWRVQGPCTIDHYDRLCLQSPNYPSNYGNNEQCNITVPNMPIKMEAFKTKRNDKLQFGQYELSGSRESGHLLNFGPNAHIIWTSDHSGTAKGWKLCAQAPDVQEKISA